MKKFMYRVNDIVLVTINGGKSSAHKIVLVHGFQKWISTSAMAISTESLTQIGTKIVIFPDIFSQMMAVGVAHIGTRGMKDAYSFMMIMILGNLRAHSLNYLGGKR